MKTNLFKSVNDYSFGAMWNPPGDEPGDDMGEGFDENSAAIESQEFDQDFQDSFESGEDEITLADDDPLSKLFKKPEKPAGEQDEDEQDSNGYQGPTSQQLTEQMEALITGFVVPEDLIPENFNPNDPRQMRDFTASLGQSIIRTSLQTMFTPVQATMNQMVHNLRTEFSQMVDSRDSNRDETSALIKAIPAWGDEAQRAVIQPLFDQAKKIHKGDTNAAVKATRSAMVALGMNPAGRKTPGQRQPGGRVSSALDEFAPLPRVKPQAPVRRGLTNGK